MIVDLLSFADRVFVDGFQHAIWAGISAFFIGMGINYARRRWQLIVAGHLPGGGPPRAQRLESCPTRTRCGRGSGSRRFSLFLFLGYTLTASSIERQVRRSPMFRGESMLADQFSESSPAP